MIVTCNTCKKEEEYPDTVWQTYNFVRDTKMKVLHQNKNEALIESCSNCQIKESAV